MRLKRLTAAGQPPDRLHHHEDATTRKNRRLAQGGEILGTAMAVGMIGVGRAAAKANREQRQHRGHHIAA